MIRTPLFALGLVSLALSAPAAEPAIELTAMSYNLRYASIAPPNSWPTRRPLVVERIRSHRPDVLGTQEGQIGRAHV